MVIRRVAASLAVLTVAGAGVGYAVTTANAASSRAPGAGSSHVAAAATGQTLSFTTKRKSLQQIDLGPQGPSAGDETLIGGEISKGDLKGFSTAECTQVTPVDHGIGQCEVDFVTTAGVLVTRGVGTGKSPNIALAVAGGTGRYAGASGSGTLTPTATGTRVTLHLH